ncbi:putative polyketide synthase domain protein [Burkholderia pseudomallei MSHR733]|nr:putative polyketide synthase domain protein [Burkholderia pseudomallei MSHR733]
MGAARGAAAAGGAVRARRGHRIGFCFGFDLDRGFDHGFDFDLGFDFGCNFGFGFDLGFGFDSGLGFDLGFDFDFDFDFDFGLGLGLGLGLGRGRGRGRNDARGRSVRAAHHARCARACAGGQPREGALHGRRRHRHRTAVHGDGTRFDRRCRVGPPGEPRLRNRHQRDSGLRLSEHRDVRGARRIADERGRRGGRGCRVRCRRLRLKR